MKPQKITKTLVDSLAVPEGAADVWAWDAELKGFGARCQKSGRKTYVIRYRTNDAARTQRKLVIARCTDVTPDKARAMARDAFAAVAGGQDPAADRKPAQAAAPTITLEQMFKARIASMRAKGRDNATEVERVLLLAAHNAADFIGRDKAPGAVTADDVVKFVAVHYAKGHRGAADKARGYLAAAFSWAIKSANDYTVAERQDWGVTHNPATDVAKDQGAVGVRERNLDAAELRAFWNVCEGGVAGFSAEVEACLRMMIACGQRVRETLRIEGRELDLENGVWHMPAHKTKGRKRDHKIPIPAIVIPTLRKLKEEHGDGLLFPARKNSLVGTIALTSISQAVRRWVDSPEATVAEFQPRDLRRTWKSRTHDAGIDRFTRDLIQQHAQNQDAGSKHYDRANYFGMMRDAMNKWNDHLEHIIYGNIKIRSQISWSAPLQNGEEMLQGAH